jgi:hypothetical protein
VHDLGIDYVFLDSIARVYGGNENDRHQVTTFVAWLRATCGGAGICLLGHPGKAPGSEFSGSTAWEASVRSRLYLAARLPDDDQNDTDEEPSTIRYLSRRKSNYSAKDWRRFEYRNGVLVPDMQRAAHGELYVQDTVMRAVARLKELDIYGTNSTASSNYLPKLARQYRLLDGISSKAFGKAVSVLVMEGRLKIDKVGMYPNRTPKVGLVLA